MPGADPGHWLHRFTAAEWIAAAQTELALGEAALLRRAVRPGVTHARRAAGMAWNAVLAVSPSPDERFGRSYMDHVTAAAAAPELPDEVRAAAKLLLETPPRAPDLVTIGRPDLSPVTAARTIIDHAASLVAKTLMPAGPGD